MDFFMSTDYPLFHFIMAILSIGFSLSIVTILCYEMFRLLIKGE